MNRLQYNKIIIKEDNMDNYLKKRGHIFPKGEAILKMFSDTQVRYVRRSQTKHPICI